MSIERGVATSARWQAQCKDCGRSGDPAEFVYPDAWIEEVIERGGTRSDRCPSCRQKHARDARLMAVPYIDLETVAEVADRENPTGPLGGLGPLPAGHDREVVKSDLSEFDFGLTDPDVSRLLRGLEKKQVAIVVAGTGSGKSTFLPYRLLVPPDDASLHLAERGPIVVTEPRVFATIDVATFIATKLHGAPAVGPGCDIGYRVKGKPVFDSGCRLLFVTDGSLINWLRDGELDKFGAIVIDEAHERSKNIDVILALLRAELPKHPNLRVIVLSATIDAKFFRDFFGGEKAVTVLDDIEVKKQWGYGKPLWPDGPVDLDHADWADDKEYRGESLRDIAERLGELRVLEGREIPQGTWRGEMPKLVAEQAVAIACGTKWGDVLGFLPGKDGIETAVGMVEEQLKEKGIAHEWDVYELLRSTPEIEQREARCAREEGDKRRIVISTNIAETSLTIDGVTYVVDSGLINQSKWDVATASKSIPAIPHSKDGVRQRWGRVGRKAPGWVFPLYTRGQFEGFLDHTPPEAVRDDLESLVLTAKAAGIDDPTSFVWPAAFERSPEEGNEEDEKVAARFREAFKNELERSVVALERRSALDEDGDVTVWGSELLGFSGSPAEAGAIAGADELSCAVEAVTAVTILTGFSVFGPNGILLFDRKWTPTARNVVRRHHEAMILGCIDELDLVLKVYAAWEGAGDLCEAWAKAHCVNHELLKEIAATRAERLEFLSPGRRSPVSEPLRLELVPRVRAVLSRALVDQTFVKNGSRWTGVDSAEDTEYLLADPSCLDGVDRVVSLRRRSGQRGGWLSGLVASYEWAAEASSWTELALEAAERLRKDGTLDGPTMAEALLFQDDWPVGARVRCSIDAKGKATAAELVAPPPSAPLAEASVEEAELDAEEAEQSDEAGQADDAERDSIDEQGQGDLVGVLAEPGEPLVNPEMEAQYEDLEELEADEEVAEADAGDSAESMAGEALPPPPLAPEPIESRPRLKFDSNDPPCGEVLVRIVGYEGLGQERFVRVVIEPDSGEPDSALAQAIQAGEERDVRALESVFGWGSPFLVAHDTRSGLDVCVPANELTLRACDQDSALEIEPGTLLSVTVLEPREPHAALTGCRLPELQRHLKEAEAVVLDEGAAPFYPATVADWRDDRFINVRLEHADEARGVLHQFSVPARALQRTSVPLSEGAPLLVQLKPEASKEPSGWIDRSFTNPPKGLRRLADGRHLTYQLGKPTMLRAAPGMSQATRDALQALSSGRAWQLAVNHLWRASSHANTSHGDIVGWVIKPIQKAPPGLAELCDDTALRLEQGQPRALKSAPGMSEELCDHLLGLSDQVHWQSVVNALWRDANGENDAVPNANGWFEKRIGGVPDGLLELCDPRTLVYQEDQATLLMAAPQMSEELRDQLLTLSDNSQWQGAVRNLWEESNGGSPPSIGSDGWAQQEVVAAPDGLEELLDDDLAFIQGQPTAFRSAPLMSLELRDSLLALSDDPIWLGTINNVWRQTNGLAVSKVRRSDATQEFEQRLNAERRDALMAMLPKDGMVTGTVTKVQEFGVIVQLNEIEGTALLHKSAVGDFGVADPSTFFAKGDEIAAQIKEVGARDGRDQILLTITGADFELDAVRRRFPEGERFEGTVSNVVDFGVFVDLGGQTGLVHKSSIGSNGALNPSRLFSVGQEVNGRVDGVARGKKNRLEIGLSMPDMELPSLLDQVREVYPDGTTVRGALNNVASFGVFIGLQYNLSGLVPNRSMSLTDRARIAGLKVGDPVDVVVVSVRMGRRRVEINLRLG